VRGTLNIVRRMCRDESTNARKRSAFRALVLSWLVVVMLPIAVAAQTPAPPQTTAPAGNAQTGKDLYLRYSCYACHGYDGHGGAGARLVPLPMALPRFTAYVRNPRQMPPYMTQVLSDAQLADLWTYIRSLPESPAAKNIPLLTRIMSEK
jgi:mono/diheme cytochrome c family protein